MALRLLSNPIHLNRLFRENGLLQIRVENGLELLDAGASKAFVVADHQIAHIYINDPSVTEKVTALLKGVKGVELILDRAAQKQHHIHHERAGDIVVVADKDSWFTYYFLAGRCRGTRLCPLRRYPQKARL
jgi:predicted AlkP superfamily pyrophosphatase or phosphodiesterase